MKDKQLARILESIEPCVQSHKELVESLGLLKKESAGDPLYNALFDACAKRFEVLFEYVWKALKVAAEYQGGEAPGPRPAIQEGIRFGWIQDPEFWADVLDGRNASVHDYFGHSDEDYLKLIERFSKEIPTLMEKLKSP